LSPRGARAAASATLAAECVHARVLAQTRHEGAPPPTTSTDTIGSVQYNHDKIRLGSLNKQTLKLRMMNRLLQLQLQFITSTNSITV
jgi:hypothetical protein